MSRTTVKSLASGLILLCLCAAGCVSDELAKKMGDGLDQQFKEKNEQIEGTMKKISEALSRSSEQSAKRFAELQGMLASKYAQYHKEPKVVFFEEDKAGTKKPAPGAAGPAGGPAGGPGGLPAVEPKEVKSELLSERTLEHRGLKLLWKLALDGSGVRYADLDEDCLYVVTNNHALYCIGARNGLIRWTYNLGCRPDSPPGFSPVYVVISAGDVIRVIEKQTGKDRWRFETDIQPASRPYCDTLGFVFGSWSGDVWGFEFGGTHPRWHCKVGDRVFSRPFLQNAFVYAAADNGSFSRYNLILQAAVGGNADLKGRPVGDLLGTKDTVYVGTENSEMVALSLVTGNRLWSHGCGGRVVAGPWLSGAGDVLYYSAHEDGFYALTTASGKQRWRLPDGLKPVAASDENIFVLKVDGSLCKVDSATGKVLWSESSAPFTGVVAQVQNELLCLISPDGQLFTLAPKK